MKIQLLPNYFKWIGLTLFIGGGIPNFMRGFAEGDNQMVNTLPFSEQAYLIAGIISLLGMIVYALSKEKIEDEFLKVLRWQSVTIAFVVSVVIVIVDMLLHGTKDIIDGQFLTELQLLSYLIVFAFKKRNVLD